MLLMGCDSPSDKTPEQIAAEVAAQQAAFEEEQRRIARENAAREARIREQRSFVEARFVAVNDNEIEVLLRNTTGKAIDNQSGSLEILDSEGNYVTGVALTNWVPGDVYLPVGESRRAIKALALETEEKRARIVREAPTYQYHFTMHQVQFVGEEEISFLDPENQAPVSVPVMTAEPPEKLDENQANPEPCGSGQISFETDEALYPGPQCEHLERNIDSERFKQEFIRRCQTETGATSPPPFAARVQLATCLKAPDGRGLLYSKRVCCDLP